MASPTSRRDAASRSAEQGSSAMEHHRHARTFRRGLVITFSTLALSAGAAAPSALAGPQGHSKSASDSKSHSGSTAADHKTSGTSGTAGTTAQPQPTSSADRHSGGANGQCPGAGYCSTRDGRTSDNGNGGGKATGKPCAGCVGKADNKNPPGQAPNGTDANAGYECDRNHGIGRTNPAHTGCATPPSTPTNCTAPPTAPGCVSGGSNCNAPTPAPSCVTTSSETCTATPTAPSCVHTRAENCTTLPDLPQCVTAGTQCAATAGTCSAVLGVQLTKTPSSRPSVEVLGETATRTPVAALPFTGVNVALMTMLALMTMMVGAAVTFAARRRSNVTR